MDAEAERLAMLRDRMLKGLQDSLPEVYVNGDLEHRIPHNLNVSFNYVEGESLIMGIKDLAVSSGSACTSASLEPSATCCARWASRTSWRTARCASALGRFTTEHEVDYAVDDAGAPRRQAARAVPALGDAPGRHRH